VQLPVDRWVCVEAQIPSNATGTTRVFIDGVQVTDVAIGKPSPQPPPNHIYFGLDWINNATTLSPARAWFDEVIVDDQPTTCAQ
jgi:hypothetical protein